MARWVVGRRLAQFLGDTDGCRVVGREALQAPQERTEASALPSARLSWRMQRGNPLSHKIAAADVKMKYRFNTCAFRLTNRAPNTGDSRHRCHLRS